jgi:ribosomal-protein-alanine N-acetyltransferase
MKLTGKSMYLRFLEESDAPSMVALNLRNREFFEPYLIDRPEKFYTVDYQWRSIQSGLALMEQDQKYSFGIFLIETESGKTIYTSLLSIQTISRDDTWLHASM